MTFSNPIWITRRRRKRVFRLHPQPDAEVAGFSSLNEEHDAERAGSRLPQFACPNSRWRLEGRIALSRWGEMTNGLGTPWCEWYDLQMLLRIMHPAEFEVVLYQEFHGGDFNWFDLLYRGVRP